MAVESDEAVGAVSEIAFCALEGVFIPKLGCPILWLAFKLLVNTIYAARVQNIMNYLARYSLSNCFQPE